MKRSQTITLLALGITLSACSGSDEGHDRVNHCDRSNTNYDSAQCDQQIQDSQHQYHHGGVAYYPWFRSNYNNTYTSRLNYGWNHGSNVFVPVPLNSSAPAIGAARAGTASVASTSAARGGFGASGAHAAAAGGGE